MSELMFSTLDGVDISVPTDADLSSAQYHFVKLDANGKCVLAGANEKTLGVLQNAPDGSSDTAVAKVKVVGVTKLVLAETVSFGKFLTPTATGTAEICDAANEEFGAIAFSAGVAGDQITCLIQHGEVTDTDA